MPDPLHLLLVAQRLEITHPAGLILDHAAALVARGYKVSVLHSGGRLAHGFQALGLRVLQRDLPAGRALDFINSRVIAREFRREGLDLVHVYGTAAARMAAQIAHKAKVPLVLSVDDLDGVSLARGLDTKTLGLILVPEPELRTRLVHEFQVPRELARVLRPGICLARTAPSPRSGAPRAPVLGSCGPFVQGSGHEALLRALAELQESCRFEAILVGDGPDRARLWQLCRSLGLEEQVVFSLDQPLRAPIFSVIDLYLDCARSNTENHDTLEAIARGSVPLKLRGEEVFELDAEGEPLLSAPRSEPLVEVLRDHLTRSPAEREILAGTARRRVLAGRPIEGYVERCVELYHALRRGLL